jgi:hypothetical protein
MQSLITLLLHLSTKAWTALVVVALCGGAATVLYFSPATDGSNSGPGNNPANLTVAIQAGRIAESGLGSGRGHQPAPVPAVPEANAGLALIPVVAAMLFFSARRLWRA